MSYQPAVNYTGASGLREQAATYYDRRGLDKLYQIFQFVQACEPRPLPRSSGRTIQWYRFSQPAANTTPVTDGVVGTPIPLDSRTVSSTVEEYNDFTDSSTLLEDTDIAPFVENMVDFMSYRAALTNDTLARIELDSATSTQVDPVGAFASVADLRANISRLKALNVMPWRGSDWLTIVHPYHEYDITSDNTAGGFIDISKYAQPQALLNNEIGKVSGSRVVSTTNVGTSGSAPATKYNMYIFGYESCLAVDLSGSGPSNVTDPKNQRFQTFVSKGGPSAIDPAGTIGTYVAYRFVTAYKVPYTSNTQYRFRTVPTDVQLV